MIFTQKHTILFKKVAHTLNGVKLTGTPLTFHTELTSKIKPIQQLTASNQTSEPQIDRINQLIGWITRNDSSGHTPLNTALRPLTRDPHGAQKAKLVLDGFTPLFKLIDGIRDTPQKHIALTRLRSVIESEMTQANMWARLGALPQVQRDQCRGMSEGLAYHVLKLVQGFTTSSPTVTTIPLGAKSDSDMDSDTKTIPWGAKSDSDTASLDSEPLDTMLPTPIDALFQFSELYPKGIPGLGYYPGSSIKNSTVLEIQSAQRGSTPNTILTQWIGHPNTPVMMTLLGETGYQPLGKLLGETIAKDTGPNTALYSRIATTLSDAKYHSFYSEFHAALSTQFKATIQGKSEGEIFKAVQTLRTIASELNTNQPLSQLSIQLPIVIKECHIAAYTQIEAQSNRAYYASPSPFSTLMLQDWITMSIEEVRFTPSHQKEAKITQFIDSITESNFRYVLYHFSKIQPLLMTEDLIQFRDKLYSKAPSIAMKLAIDERNAALILKRSAAPWLQKMPETTIKASLETIGRRNGFPDSEKWSKDSRDAVTQMRKLALALTQVPKLTDSLDEQLTILTTRAQAARILQDAITTMSADKQFAHGVPKIIVREGLLLFGMVFVAEPVLCTQTLTQGFMSVGMNPVPRQGYFGDTGRKKLEAIKTSANFELTSPNSQTQIDVQRWVSDSDRITSSNTRSTVGEELLYLYFSITESPQQPLSASKSVPALVETVKNSARDTLAQIIFEKGDPLSLLNNLSATIEGTASTVSDISRRESFFDRHNALSYFERLTQSIDMIVDAINVHAFNRLGMTEITGHDEAIRTLSRLVDKPSIPEEDRHIIRGTILQIQSIRDTPYRISLHEILDGTIQRVQSPDIKTPLTYLRGHHHPMINDSSNPRTFLLRSPQHTASELQPLLRNEEEEEDVLNDEQDVVDLELPDIPAANEITHFNATAANSALSTKNLTYFKNIRLPESESTLIRSNLEQLDIISHSQASFTRELQAALEKTLMTLIQKIYPETVHSIRYQQVITALTNPDTSPTPFDTLKQSLARIATDDALVTLYLDKAIAKEANEIAKVNRLNSITPDHPFTPETLEIFKTKRTVDDMKDYLIGSSLLTRSVRITPDIGLDTPIDWTNTGVTGLADLREKIQANSLTTENINILSQKGIVFTEYTPHNKAIERALSRLKILIKIDGQCEINPNIFKTRLTPELFQPIAKNLLNHLRIIEETPETHNLMLNAIRSTLINSVLSVRDNIKIDRDANEIIHIIGIRDALPADHTDVVPRIQDVMQTYIRNTLDGFPPLLAIRTIEIGLLTLIRDHKRKDLPPHVLQQKTEHFLQISQLINAVKHANRTQVTTAVVSCASECQTHLRTLSTYYPNRRNGDNEIIDNPTRTRMDMMSETLSEIISWLDHPGFSKLGKIAKTYTQRRENQRALDQLLPVANLIEILGNLAKTNGTIIAKVKLAESDIITLHSRLNDQSKTAVSDLAVVKKWFGEPQAHTFIRIIDNLAKEIPPRARRELATKDTASQLSHKIDQNWFNLAGTISQLVDLSATYPFLENTYGLQELKEQFATQLTTLIQKMMTESKDFLARQYLPECRQSIHSILNLYIQHPTTCDIKFNDELYHHVLAVNQKIPVMPYYYHALYCNNPQTLTDKILSEIREEKDLQEIEDNLIGLPQAIKHKKVDLSHLCNALQDINESDPSYTSAQIILTHLTSGIGSRKQKATASIRSQNMYVTSKTRSAVTSASSHLHPHGGGVHLNAAHSSLLSRETTLLRDGSGSDDDLHHPLIYPKHGMPSKDRFTESPLSRRRPNPESNPVMTKKKKGSTGEDSEEEV